MMLLRSVRFASTFGCTRPSLHGLHRTLSSTSSEAQVFRDRLAALGSGQVLLRKDDVTGLACIELQNSASRNGAH
eukprot:4701-Heterococcus_DN1.PRE.2